VLEAVSDHSLLAGGGRRKSMQTGSLPTRSTLEGRDGRLFAVGISSERRAVMANVTVTAT